MNQALSQEEANTALALLGQKHGVQDLALESDSLSTSLAFSEQFLIVFQYSSTSGLTLWSPLHSLDLAETASAERRLLRHLLQENGPSGSIAPSALAIDEHGGILLKRNLLLHAGNLEELADETQLFAQQVELVSAQLSNVNWADSASEERLSLEPQLGQDAMIRI